jgi:hypothetical protein
MVQFGEQIIRHYKVAVSCRDSSTNFVLAHIGVLCPFL